MKRRYKLVLILFSFFHSSIHALCVYSVFSVSYFFNTNLLHLTPNKTLNAAKGLALSFLPLQRHGVGVAPIFGNNGSVSSLQNITV